MIPKPVILDISEWQAPSQINYDQLSQQIDGVIVRVQYGSLYTDKHYQTHIRAFQAHKIPVGVYAWVRGTSISDMEQEAADFYQRAKAFQPTFWWLDVEEHSMANMRAGCEAFRKKLKALGAKKVGAYIANHLYASFQLDTDKFDGIWLPTYGQNTGSYQGANPTASKKYNLHQYTSAGKLKGYAGPLDLNRLAKGDFADFFGAASKPVPKPTAFGLRFQLQTAVYLRKAPKTTAASMAILRKGDQVILKQVQSSEGYLWGEQTRQDGSSGYLALGLFNPYGTFI
ncbi:glycoside hydrolase family 25 protein [Candidatus Enterococcus willemsii]|uniref:Glycoside hydrolase family 25 n=1 Tax=Candidatus Enterococcus willemsii TaxID=1857215 RepID=A0ABQ6Z1U6_9ENTE|nr:glycoside hydrolase family 25 protein [Enterococcus sp. CU12B]KAF1305342.1 glycoside hydrolase family 25 [Enterococcus sp. CU12B]